MLLCKLHLDAEPLKKVHTKPSKWRPKSWQILEVIKGGKDFGGLGRLESIGVLKAYLIWRRIESEVFLNPVLKDFLGVQ